MVNSLIYFFVALIASIIGSFLGIGGGVIIMPSLLSLGIVKELAAFSSSVTVLIMSIISSATYSKRKQGDMKTALYIVTGSIPGSYLGTFINGKVSPKMFNLLFGYLVILLLVLMFAKSRLPKFNLGKTAKVIFGLFIGILAGLFGIGGGPIVIPVLLVFFGLQQKEASATSSYVTLVTALTSVISYILAGNRDFSIAVYMIPGAIIGAKIGTYFNKRMSEKWVSIIFNTLLVYLLIKQFLF